MMSRAGVVRARFAALWLGALGGCTSDPAEHAPLGMPALGNGVEPAASTEQSLSALVGARQGRWLAARAARVQAPERTAAAASLPARVALPAQANEAFTLVDAASELGIQVRLQGAHAVSGETLGGLQAYAGAAGPGSALVLRPSAAGVEDYVAFAAPPARAELDYQVELAPEVAGLRLVEHTLEFLDRSGAPRLRVAPPYVLGADGALARAELAVQGCAVDTDPAPPWGRVPRAPGARRCDVRVSWHGAGLEYPVLVDPAWTTASSLSEARARFASVTLPDGRVLAAGGQSSAGQRSASAELYDPTSDTWSVTGSLIEPRRHFTLTVRSDADGGAGALAAGGDGLAGALSSTEIYDTASGTWSPGPELPIAYVGHAAVRFADGSVLVAGGSGSGFAALLAPGAPGWSPAGELENEEPGASLTLLNDGRVLLLGPNPPSAQLFSLGSARWVATGQPALARSEHTATLLSDGRVLIVGGHVASSDVSEPPGSEPPDGGAGSPSPVSGASPRLAELYDPLSESFSFVGGTNEVHAEHTATRLSDGRVAVVGGMGLSGANATEIYNPTWGTWTSGPGTSQGRAEHAAALLADGRLLAFGGVGPDGTLLQSADQLDATATPTTISEYKLPATLDRDVTSSVVTELWASIARPATLVEGRRYPVLVFLHGNHATCGIGDNPRQDFSCQYTDTGTCPEGFVVSPSHRGYDYVGSELAARGFIVVSVNANRGITCGPGEQGDSGFNLARGRLLLKHLQLLSAYNRGLEPTPESVGVSLEGKLDFSELGMMGHSRGGEGVRAAYEQFRDPNSPWPRRIGEPVVFRALFEIGPVDGQTSRVLNADGTAWNVLLPMCDGDVSNLQGVKPFDRMLALPSELREAAKSTYVAWGTNHNYFNSEWQQSDSSGCQSHRALFSDGPGISGSAEQRQVGLRSMLTFFLANVGARRNTSLNELFDPTSELETSTRIDRGYAPSLRPGRGLTLEDFSGPDGRSTRGLPTSALNVDVRHTSVPEHDERLRGALVRWSAAEPGSVERFFELPFSASPGGVELGRYTHLEFRAGRAAGDDLLEPTPLVVQLVNADGSLSEPLDSAAYGLRLDGPVGGPFSQHVVLQTARIPLGDFASATPDAVRGVRFGFPGAGSGSVFLANVRVGLGSASLSPVQATTRRARAALGGAAGGRGTEASRPLVTEVIPGQRPRVLRQLSVEGNSVVALRPVENQRVELELSTPQPFQAQGDLLVLDIGKQRTTQSRHPGGSMTRVVFTLDARTFVNLRNGERLRVHYAANDARQWDFGQLDKSRLAR
jgi:Kelch motif protein